MSDVIGSAAEFYRLRVVRVDESDVPDLDWREDILYRRPREERPAEYDVWRVEAVDVDDDENVTSLASLPSTEEAHEWLETVAADLAVMTRSEFENTYFPGDDEKSGAGVSGLT